ncbi:MAG TPA: ABC transporter permease [Silvibacterium sp.]|nr:ABC transporter permease [Silvibacterium sp.]
MQAFRDIRFGARRLAANPGFAAVAIITLALAIGMNTAIFSVTSALLLRPFPYHEPQKLVSIEVVENATSQQDGTLLRYELLRDRAHVFESVAAWANDNFNLTGAGDPVQVPVARVTPNFFSTLGVRPQIGRTFTDDEGRLDGKPVVVLGDSIWRTRFGSDPNVVGRTLALDGTPHTVIGVLPAGVQFPFVGAADIWTPRYFEHTLFTPQRLRMGVGYLGLLARLGPATTIAQGDAELAVINRQYREQNPTSPDAGSSVEMRAVPLRDVVVGDTRGKLWLLSAAVAVLLLIGCANVASLLLSRALARRRELAVCAALGASRGAVVRQLLAESTLLALVAGALGVLLGWAADRALTTWGVGQLPQGISVELDGRVLLFTLGIALLTGIVTGVFPAMQMARTDLNSTLRDEGRGVSGGRAKGRLKSLLVVGQVALSILLLIGAGLLLRSFERLLRVDPGFEVSNVLTMNVSLPTQKYAKPEQQIAFFDEVLRRVSGLPGVRDAAISAALPLSWKRITPVLPDGQPNVPLAQRPFIDIEAVSPGWFGTMRVPMVAGRAFTEADDAQSPKVLVVNQTFARRFWPSENPIGERVVVGRGPVPSEVVGVAADVRNKGLAEETQPQLYLPFKQLPWGNMNLLVRTGVAPLSMASAVRGQISAVDPDQPVMAVQTVDDLMDGSRAQPRFMMALLGVFSVTALGLAAIGLYAVLAWSVAQRRQEIGIRLALGAEKRDVLWAVVRQGLVLVVAGIVIGLAAGVFLTKLMSGALYKTSARDLKTFAVAPLVFLGIALVASYLPARRAAKVDPLEAMREA